MKILTDRGTRRIAVLGGNNAGKTVFITSLLDNLVHYDPERLNCGDEWDVSGARMTNEGKVAGLDRFPLEVYRQKFSLESPKWPKKTFSASIACLDVTLERREDKKKWYKRDFKERKLEIVDIAGERTADFGMIKRTFREWSMMTVNKLVGAGIDWVRIFKDRTSVNAENKSAVLDGYRDVLKELYAKGANASMTPSTARISAEGKSIGGDEDEDKILYPEEYRKALQDHPVGLEGGEFAPLPESAFEKGGFEPLAKGFEAAYNEYKSKIVEPIWGWLKGANDIVYLVDIPGVLANGTAAYNAEQDLSEGCFQAIRNAWRQEESFIMKSKEWLKAKMYGCHFSRLIAVATKADLVHKEDRDNMAHLAEKLIYRNVRNCGFDNIEHTYCAAVCADLEAADAAGVPDKWDDDWKPGKYLRAQEIAVEDGSPRHSAEKHPFGPYCADATRNRLTGESSHARR